MKFLNIDFKFQLTHLIFLSLTPFISIQQLSLSIKFFILLSFPFSLAKTSIIFVFSNLVPRVRHVFSDDSNLLNHTTDLSGANGGPEDHALVAPLLQNSKQSCNSRGWKPHRCQVLHSLETTKFPPLIS
ncbi:hypothetical protein HN51_057979 [Arachis hypogaea]